MSICPLEAVPFVEHGQRADRYIRLLEAFCIIRVIFPCCGMPAGVSLRVAGESRQHKSSETIQFDRLGKLPGTISVCMTIDPT